MGMGIKEVVLTLIREEVAKLISEDSKEQFAPAPKMGDINPTDQSNKDRPAMENRPTDGMDIKQHKKMLWSESIDFRNSDEIMSLVQRIRMMRSMDVSRDIIVDKLAAEYDIDDIQLAYYAAKVLDKDGALEEFNAMGTGAVAGFTGPLGMGAADLSPIHDKFWSGDKSEKPKKKRKK